MNYALRMDPRAVRIESLLMVAGSGAGAPVPAARPPGPRQIDREPDITEPEEEAPVVVDARVVTPLWTGPSGGTARLLLTNPRPSPVEVWRWILHPGERYESNPHPAGATETLTVIRGRMTFTAGDAAQRLRGGETAVFAADVPHSYEGSGRGPCELIMTVHIPPEHHNG